MAFIRILYKIVRISAAILLYLISAHKYDTIYLKKNRANNKQRNKQHTDAIHREADKAAVSWGGMGGRAVERRGSRGLRCPP